MGIAFVHVGEDVKIDLVSMYSLVLLRTVESVIVGRFASTGSCSSEPTIFSAIICRSVEPNSSDVLRESSAFRPGSERSRLNRTGNRGGWWI